AASVLATCGGLGEVEEDERGGADERGGRELFAAIYGENAEEVRRGLHAAHPELARWIAEHAYARVLARPGLSADRRALLAVAALAVQGQDRQLAAHARGAVRLGARAEEVRATVEAVGEFVAAEVVARARDVVERFARA